MDGIVDAVLTGQLSNKNVTQRYLYYGDVDGIDLCTVFRLRREVLDRYLDVDLPELGVHCGDLEAFRIVLADHESYRTYVRRGAKQAVAVDTKWKARCKQSSILALDLLEDRRLSKLRLDRMQRRWTTRNPCLHLKWGGLGQVPSISSVPTMLLTRCPY
jgi:hypothetical protein